MGRLVRRLGCSPQRPLHRAYERGPAWVEPWWLEEFSAIQRQAKADNALIFFTDERVWKQIRQASPSHPWPTRHDLKPVAFSALHSLQQMPEQIRGFFRDPACCCAAACVSMLSMAA